MFHNSERLRSDIYGKGFTNNWKIFISLHGIYIKISWTSCCIDKNHADENLNALTKSPYYIFNLKNRYSVNFMTVYPHLEYQLYSFINNQMFL